MGYPIRKYPRTPHLQGSKLQAGDEDLSQVPFSSVLGRHIVVEEKIDGANVAVSFDTDGTLLLQSRGHYLVGGGREVHYDLMKQWARVHSRTFYEVLGTRYIMYGEWMYAKHRMYYDSLPHYFMEFDIYDRERDIYLDTPARAAMTAQMPVVSVPVLASGVFRTKEEILNCIGPSLYMSEENIPHLIAYCEAHGLDTETCLAETDTSGLMEGLYIKAEDEGRVVERVKFVRAGFAQTKEVSAHWLHKEIVPNGLSVPFENLFI